MFLVLEITEDTESIFGVKVISNLKMEALYSSETLSAYQTTRHRKQEGHDINFHMLGNFQTYMQKICLRNHTLILDWSVLEVSLQNIYWLTDNLDISHVISQITPTMIIFAFMQNQ
jgi:hypothetical protein